jgi:hypothetical protein
MKTNIKILRGDYSKKYCSFPTKRHRKAIYISDLEETEIKKARKIS